MEIRASFSLIQDGIVSSDFAEDGPGKSMLGERQLQDLLDLGEEM